MRIALLVLTGDPANARECLQQRYPGAGIESILREELERSSPARRIRTLRSLRPDVFAVATEKLAWQRDQDALLLFGVLAGARRVILFDPHGETREETRVRILSRMPFRFVRTLAASKLTIARSRSGLKQLEQAAKDRVPPNLAPGPPNRGPLRIAYLRSTPCAGTLAGGAATHINGFVNAATELGAQVTVISNDHIAGLDETKLRLIDPQQEGVTRAAFDLRNNLVFSAGALSKIERMPAELIYERYARFTWAGVKASLRTNLPLFLEFNGSEVWVGQNWDKASMIPLLERFERLNLEAAARIFVVSEVERRNLLRAGIADEKIVVNPNGVDTEKFRPGVGGAAVRRELRVADDETLAGFVGTFGPWHGALTLAEAITLVPDDSAVRFLLVGSGRLRDDVERVIRTAGKQAQVILAGQVEHDRVPALLDACDILLSPHVPFEDGSEFFGSPTKLFEYMAMGKGIIASRLGQIGDVLVNEETALLIEPGNARELSEAILRLSQSSELRESLGAAARRAAVERHTWKHNAARVLDSYRESELSRPDPPSCIQ
jgi:glycosyltransferase involved in cell wall biosynthesis